MVVIKYDQVDLTEIGISGATSVSKAVVIDERDGWDGYALRVFRLGAGGFTPQHSHDWEHVNYVMAGRGKLTIGSEVHDLDPGDFAFVPAGAEHQFENPGNEEFEFICIVPDRGEH